jgi:hypothetical protein
MAAVLTLNASVKAVISSTVTKAFPIGQGQVSTSVSNGLTMADTATLNPTDLVFEDTISLAGGATKTYDLQAAGGSDPVEYWGDACAFANVHALYFYNTTGTTIEGGASTCAVGTCKIQVGNAASNQWPAWFDAVSHYEVVEPGSFCVHTNGKTGWPVTASSGDQLLIKNLDGANAVTGKLMIFGRSTAMTTTTTTSTTTSSSSSSTSTSI